MAADEIDIAFGINDAYVPHLSAVVTSIVRHAPDARLRFIILHDGVSHARRKLVEGTAPSSQFIWAEVDDADVPEFVDHSHFNRTTLFRFQLETLAPPDCRRLIYLDTDVIVLSDVRELWAIDLGDAAVGAVIDGGAAVDRVVVPADFAARWRLPAPYSYFNAGVLLIDLRRVRAGELFSAAAQFFAKNRRSLPFNDQDALNWKFWGRWKSLPPTWNAQLDMVVPWLSQNLPQHLQFHNRLPALVHFTGAGKPWTAGSYHPWAWIYWENLARTPFLQEVAAASGIGVYRRMRIWLRWMRRRPPCSRLPEARRAASNRALWWEQASRKRT